MNCAVRARQSFNTGINGSEILSAIFGSLVSNNCYFMIFSLIILSRFNRHYLHFSFTNFSAEKIKLKLLKNMIAQRLSYTELSHRFSKLLPGDWRNYMMAYRQKYINKNSNTSMYKAIWMKMYVYDVASYSLPTSKADWREHIVMYVRGR